MPPTRPGCRGRGKITVASPSHPKGSSKAKSLTRQRTFDEFYSEVYGERWTALRAAMTKASAKVAVWNRFCQIPFEEATIGLTRVDPHSMVQAFHSVSLPSTLENAEEQGDGISENTTTQRTPRQPAILDKPPVDAFGIKAYYLLDYASAYIVEQLQVGPFDTVLDMCAAPGGKSIVIAQFLSPDGALTCNEARPDRCARLRRNLLEHVPVNYTPWKTTQRDAQTWYDPGAYSRVLVDAPCSSERHLLQQSGGSPISPQEWSEETTAELATLQRMLLLRAIETCRVGGRIVYSTCSISPMENDGVIAEVLRRTRCEIRVVKLPSETGQPLLGGGYCAGSSEGKGSEAANALQPPTVLGEPTAYGHLVLPDTCSGWGPMFYCILEKTAEHRKGMSTSSSESGDDEGAVDV